MPSSAPVDSNQQVGNVQVVISSFRNRLTGLLHSADNNGYGVNRANHPLKNVSLSEDCWKKLSIKAEMRQVRLRTYFTHLNV